MVEWLVYFGQELIASETIPEQFDNKESLIKKILDNLQPIEKKIPESILPTFSSGLDRLLEAISKEEILQSLVERLSDWIKLIRNLQSTKKTYELPPSLDDLLGSTVSLSSKRPLEDKPNQYSDTKKRHLPKTMNFSY